MTLADKKHKVEAITAIEQALQAHDGAAFIRALAELPQGSLAEENVRFDCFPLIVHALSWLKQLAAEGEQGALVSLCLILEAHPWLGSFLSMADDEAPKERPRYQH